MTKVSHKIYLQKNLPFYLAELKQFTGINVDSKSLSSIEEVERIREQSLVLNDLKMSRFSMRFSDRNSEQFKKFIESLKKANSNSIYIWLYGSNLHGLFKVASIDVINFSFPFNVNQDGIVIFLASDFNDKLLLDFYCDSEDQEILEIELRGKHWSSIPFNFENLSP
jgi:hypothetical protein